MLSKQIELTEEEMRLLQVGGVVSPWRKWGPYVSERAWGTVREDYSSDGNAWDYFTYQMAHSKVYRWGEDGIAGLCDRYQVLLLTHAFWNGQDPTLKERLFGLGTHQGNHGEDVKEYYFHLDCTPTHSYMKYLYKYPCLSFPYEKLYTINKSRGLKDLEYELVDTGIFDERRYFDIFIEYAKVNKDDIILKVEICNRSKQEESLHYLPQLFFRNTWSWGDKRRKEPIIKKGEDSKDAQVLIADDSAILPPSRLSFDYHLGKRYFYADKSALVLFTNNESNKELLFGEKNDTTYVRDAFHRYIIEGKECINKEGFGTKACFYYRDLKVPSGSSKVLYFRLNDSLLDTPLAGVEEIVRKRKEESDRFYEKIAPKKAGKEDREIQKQALSGMLWNKQIYLFDVNLWLKGDSPAHAPPSSRKEIRNVHWKHLISKRILSMPDKWEYPWFAAWDLAFHCISLALVDLDFAKEQLWYLLFDQFQHPNGQIPAYEWEFSDMNPPVQAWAAYRLYMMEFKKKGIKDTSFLKKCFHKLMLNFVWWVNKVDTFGNNVFEGGFLGLDNITVIDRSQKIPGGGQLEQSDGTGWMGFFCLMLMKIGLELSKEDPVYEGIALKFFEHFVYIANALVNADNRLVQNWNEEEGFFYDVLRYPSRGHEQIHVRSLVGIIPIFAIDCIKEEELASYKEFSENFTWFIKNRDDICHYCVTPLQREGKTDYLLSLMDLNKMKKVLSKIWDPHEFRSPYGLRSLSKYHEEHPYEFLGSRVSYAPGEAESFLKGGNSNWRGPIWFPTTFLLIEALNGLHKIVGNDFKIQVAGEKEVTTKEMARYFAESLVKLFKRDEQGKRPIYGGSSLFQDDPHFRDYFLYFEHFHGDSGRGLGASHQTGWTGLVANIIDEWID